MSARLLPSLRRERARHGVGARLAAGFGALLLLLCGISGAGLWRLQQLSDEAVAVLERRIPRLALLQDGVAEINRLGLAARDALLQSDPAAVERQLQVIERGRAGIGQRIEALQAALGDDANASTQKIADDFGQHSSGILVALVKFSRTVKGGDKAAAATVLDQTLQPKLEGFSATISAFLAGEMTALDRSKQQMVDQRRSAMLQTAALVALALASGVAAAMLITRSITRPLARAVCVADRVATGDLSGEIVLARDDELGRLLAALARMQQSLTSTVAQVRDGCETVAGASAEIALGNGDLSARTEQQAAALEQTAAAMEQLGTTVRQNADNAREASRLARDASEVAQRGGAVVGDVVSTMKGINHSARRIADITNLIDGIAFQTNILALNAAVEAARAGEHGRGFAVVASEVRSLAQRSAEAAKEIKGLIADSATRVDAGSRLVDQAGQTMQEIVSAIVQVSTIVGEISHASSEQTAGIAQVGQAVTQMDQATQHNAGLVAQTAAAAERLKTQASELVDAVAVFRLAPASPLGAVGPSAQVADDGVDHVRIVEPAPVA